MAKLRPFSLILAMIAATLSGVTLTAAPASAQTITTSVIDGFGAGATGSTAQRAWDTGTGYLNSPSSYSILTIPNGNGEAARLTYTFPSPVDLTSGGGQSLVFEPLSVATTGDQQLDGVNFSATITNSSSATASISLGIKAGQTTAVMPLVKSGVNAVGFSPTIDMTHVTSIEFVFATIRNMPSASNSITFDSLEMQGEAPTQQPQSINFTSSSGAATVGTTRNVTATATSGLPVTFNITGASSSICSISGSTVTFNHVGTCTVQANQGGNSSFFPAMTVAQSITVNRGTQGIDWTAPISANVGESTAVTATGTKQASTPVVTPYTPEVCTVNETTVTYEHVGTCRYSVSMMATTDYLTTAPEIYATQVNKGSQTWANRVPNPTDRVGSTLDWTGKFTESATNLASTLKLAVGTTACSISDRTITLLHTGSCVVYVSGVGNADYDAPPTTTVLITVGRGVDGVVITSGFSDGKVGQTFQVGGMGLLSGLPAVPTISSLTTNNACTLSGSNLLFQHPGNCAVDFDTAGNDDWAPATITRSVTVAKASQSTTVTTGLVGGKVGTSQTVVASGSGNTGPAAVTLNTADTTNNACTVAGSVVTMQHVGTCAVQVAAAANGDYEAGFVQDFSVQVSQGDQVFTWSAYPSGGPVGSSQYVIAYGSQSGVSATVIVDGLSNGACSVMGNLVSYNHAGTCSLWITGGGDADWNEPPVQLVTAVVGQGSESVTVTDSMSSTSRVGQSVPVAAHGTTSQTPAVPTVSTATTNNACTVANGSVTFQHVGHCEITFTTPASADWDSSSVSAIADVVKGSQTTVVSSGLVDGKVGESQTVVASGSGTIEPADVVLNPGDTTNDACTLAGDAVTFDHVGTCAITVQAAADDDYEAGDVKSYSVAVAKGDQDFTWSAVPETGPVGSTHQIEVQGDRTGVPATATIDALNTTNNACSVMGTTVTYLHAGTCAVLVSGGGNDDWNAPTPLRTISNVTRAAQTIAFASAVPDAPVYPTTTYTVKTSPGGGSGNTVTIGTATPQVCSAAGSTVRFLKAGTCTITADQAGNADHAPAPQALQEVSVTRIPSTVTVAPDIADAVFGQPVHPVAKVAPVHGTSAGNVQFSLDGVHVGSPVAMKPDGTATGPALPSPAVGTHQLKATFVPKDPDVFTSGESGTGPVSVGVASTTTSVTVTRTGITATVAPVAPGQGEPTGSVEFKVDGTSVGNASISEGVATLARKVPSGSERAVSAIYSGSKDFSASSASTARRDPVLKATVSSTSRKSRAGWYRKPVTVRFTCTTSGSPLAGDCPGPVRLAANKAAQKVTRTIEAENGGIDTLTVSGINIDRVKPKIRFKGIRKTVTGRTPKVRCRATDRLSGIRSCHIRVTRSAKKVTWRAVAKDKAGNKRVAKRSAKVIVPQVFTLSGVPTHHGVPQVREGHSYTMVVVSKQRPRYVNAAVAPRRPQGLSMWFIRSGSVNGTPRWVLGVTFKGNMASAGTWNIGAKIGRTLKVIKVHVTR